MQTANRSVDSHMELPGEEKRVSVGRCASEVNALPTAVFRGNNSPQIGPAVR